MATQTITKSELASILTKLAKNALQYAREDRLHHHLVAQTKEGLVNITYNPGKKTYTLVAQQNGGIELKTLIADVPSRLAVAKLVEVFDVHLVDTVAVDG